MSNTDPNMVLVDKREYNQLIKDTDWLAALEAAGVDNWEGIDEAISIYNENKTTKE